MTTVITYGTFDLFHIGHLRLLERLASLGDRLVVGVSSDQFNALKGKRCITPFDQRAAIVSAIRFVDSVFAENNWEQKRGDILREKADIFAMGDDWVGKFDDLNEMCKVIYLPRTRDISTTEIKQIVSSLDLEKIQELRAAIAHASDLAARL